MKESLERFVQVRDELLDLVSRFPPGQREKPVCGEWDLRCVLAHVAGWDGYFAGILERLRAGKEVPRWGDIDAFNAASVRERQDRSWDQVYAEFVTAGERFVEAYGDIGEDLWQRRFWDGANPTPAWVVEVNVEHYGEHLEELKLEE